MCPYSLSSTPAPAEFKSFFKRYAPPCTPLMVWLSLETHGCLIRKLWPAPNVCAEFCNILQQKKRKYKLNKREKTSSVSSPLFSPYSQSPSFSPFIPPPFSPLPFSHFFRVSSLVSHFCLYRTHYKSFYCVAYTVSKDSLYTIYVVHLNWFIQTQRFSLSRRGVYASA